MQPCSSGRQLHSGAAAHPLARVPRLRPERPPPKAPGGALTEGKHGLLVEGIQKGHALSRSVSTAAATCHAAVPRTNPGNRKEYVRRNGPYTISRSSGEMNNMDQQSTPFPFVDFEQLLAHPKALKRDDLKRILRSPQSEDWVTWNVLRVIQRRTSWWPALVSLAREEAVELDDSLVSGRTPAVVFWHRVPTPCAYEHASRVRMASSDNAKWRKRAENPRPVEGPTEVDAVFEGTEYLVFVEAKLGSDVSERTTYDPLRNQIVRNVDCAIEEAGDRQPIFWMFVKDRQPQFKYSNIIDEYRSDVRLLESQLPHRDPAVLARLVKGIAVVEWRELMTLLPDTLELTDLLTEIRRRVE